MLSVAFIEGKEGKGGKDGSGDVALRVFGHQAVKIVALLKPIYNSAAKGKSHSAGHYFYSLQKIKYANVLQLHPKNAADSPHFSFHG